MTSILTFEQDAVPRALKAQVLAILEVAWPSGRSIEERLDRPLHDPRSAPVCMLLVDGEVVLAYLAIPSKVIQHAGVTYRVAGLSSVATHPDHLRHGYGGMMVVAAREWNCARATSGDSGTADVARAYAVSATPNAPALQGSRDAVVTSRA